MAILNTGPQLLQLSAPTPTTLGGMNRGVPNDQARFVITRLGDTNGPGNDAGSGGFSRQLQNQRNAKRGIVDEEAVL